MSKHTKGPWNVVQMANDSFKIFRFKKSITGTDNANLIAAAPELLESLRYLLNMVNNAPFELSDEQETERVRAHNAITKAEGGAK